MTNSTHVIISALISIDFDGIVKIQSTSNR